MKLIAPGEPQQDVSIFLIGLKTSDQPDALFELPEGGQVMSMDGMQTGIFGSVTDFAGDVAHQAAEAAAREADQQVRNKATQKAGKLVRKIFKW